MKSIVSKRVRLSQILLGAALLSVIFLAPEAKADDEHQHVVTDWSHRHVVFSDPKTLMKRFQLSTNPRYEQHVRRRIAAKRGVNRSEWRWYHAPADPNHFQGDWSMDMGTGATVGAGNYPAKFSFNTTSANCATPAPPVGQQPDFIVYNTSLPGSGTQATIVAFDNIYTGTCTGGTPQTYWAYNTGTTGAVVTSPVLSFDGKQVAFVQNTATGANLVILRWKANNGTLLSPIVPTSGPCTALTAPCMVTVPFSTANGDPSTLDTTSSPFCDYFDDVIYAGDTSGFLHKFTGVFAGTPTEVVATGPNHFWPANLTGASGFVSLNSPVFVDGVNEVFVTATDGVIYVADSTIGGLYPTGANFLDPKLASPGFDDGPIVDATSGKLYLFARASSEFIDTASTSGFHGTPGVPSVFELDIPATPPDIHLASYIQAIVSNSTTLPNPAFYTGAFDDAYYSTSGASGNLYVCSTRGTVNAIWGIPITNNVMGTPFPGPTLTTANVGCSPITEFSNTNTNIDRLFLSVAGSPVTGGTINCPSSARGCVMSFRVDSPLSTTTPTSATTAVTGGTSAIVIDNSAAAGGASQVYFTPLGNQACAGSGGIGVGTGGCAIQASQSGLN
jgi:hypothetical protein